MFGKKKPPSPPYILQVLTTEYLIEGTVDGNTHLYIPTPGSLGSIPFRLSSVQIQPTRLVDIPTRTYPLFEVWGESAVVIIPRMEVSLMAQYEGWCIPKIPLRGLFYFGSYLVQGTLMRGRNDSFEIDMPIFDVTITNQVPGAHWGEIRPNTFVALRQEGSSPQK
jgi:hypothetical protein